MGSRKVILVQNFVSRYLFPLICLAMAAATAAGLYQIRKDMVALSSYQAQEAQFLASSHTFETERQRLTFFLRDLILSYWNKDEKARGGYDRAFHIADVIVSESYKYPYRAPHENAALLSAILAHESGFRDSLKSETGSSGMPQFTRGTARMTARMLGLEYSPEMLLDCRVSIRMQAALLDVLHESYPGDLDKVLSVYNLGRVDDSSKYVPMVRGTMEGFLRRYSTYRMTVAGIPVGSAAGAAETTKVEKK